MHRFIDLTLNGLTIGSVYAALALSLVLIWRSTRVLNFAQGAMAMFTTYIAVSVIDRGASVLAGARRRPRRRLRHGRHGRARPRPSGRDRTAAERRDPDPGRVHLPRSGGTDDLGGQDPLVPDAVLQHRDQGRLEPHRPLALRHLHARRRGGDDGGADRAVPGHQPGAAHAGGGVCAGGVQAARHQRRAGCSPWAGRSPPSWAPSPAS